MEADKKEKPEEEELETELFADELQEVLDEPATETAESSTVAA